MSEKNAVELKISGSLYVLKALAIICVAAAHCPGFNSPFAESARALLGTLGVPVFLICSGFFFKRDEEAKTFWLKKLKTIVVPWLVWGVITFMIPVLAGTYKFGVLPLAKWIIGYKTWLYFVPVLLLCFVLFRISKARAWDIFMLTVFAASWILTYAKVLKYGKLITEYQNVFNFTGFFLLGMFLRKKDALNKLCAAPPAAKIGVSVLWILTGVLYAVFGKSIIYWGSLMSIPFELLGFVSLFWLSCRISESRLLKDMGKRTFFIYFLHMQIGYMAINAVFGKLPLNSAAFEFVLAFVKPCAVVLFIYLLWFIAKKVFSLLKLEKLSWIFSV